MLDPIFINHRHRAILAILVDVIIAAIIADIAFIVAIVCCAGQLWADGRSTLQLHQQKPTPTVSGSLITAVVLPPDSEVVANFLIDGGQLGTCALINPSRDLTEDFGVIVGHTLVDATTPSANVLIINPNAEEVVLPCGAHIGDLVPVLAVSVAVQTCISGARRTSNRSFEIGPT